MIVLKKTTLPAINPLTPYKTNMVCMTLMERIREFGLQDSSNLALADPYYFVFRIANNMTGYEKLFQPMLASLSPPHTGDIYSSRQRADRTQMFQIFVDAPNYSNYTEWAGSLSFTGSEAISASNDNGQWTYEAWAVSNDAWPRPISASAGAISIPSGPTASYLLESGRMIISSEESSDEPIL